MTDPIEAKSIERNVNEGDLAAGGDPSLLVALAARWAELEAERVDIENTQAVIKRELRRVYGIGKHAAGALTVNIRPNRRFSPTRAAQVLTAEQLAAVCVTVPDSKLAREHLSHSEYEECQEIVGDPVVRIS